jgi:hypothetical protein
LKEFDIKRGHFKNIEGEKLKELLSSTFNEGKIEVDNEKLLAYYGALQPLTAWIKGKDVLCVETNMKADVDDELINKTIRLYNQFLEAATGFNSKERVKRSKKKVE